MKISEKFDSIVIGPGIGLDEDTKKFCLEFIKNNKKPMVIDADALSNISDHLNILKDLSYMKILTPHPGEMSRLTGLSKEKIQNDRIASAKNLSKETNSTIILKGSGAVIACPSGEISINSTGNPGMASGGTGDVLSGILGALLAQGYGEKEAAEIGVYLHGLSGDILSKKKGFVGIAASEIANNIPVAIKHTIND